MQKYYNNRYRGGKMKKEFVTKHDPKGIEYLIAKEVSFYEAYSLVVDSRCKKDGNFYRVGKPYNENFVDQTLSS
jgi:hypothetical protein